MWLPTDERSAHFLEEFGGICDRYYARALDERDWAAWFDGQLQQVVRHVQDRSPFYGRHLDGIDPATVTRASLDALPFTTKDDLRREMYDVLSGPVREATFFYETTGTTGRATPCPRDSKEVIASNWHVTASWRSIFEHHFGQDRPAIGLMGPTEVHSFGDTLGDVARNVGSCNAKIWPYSPLVGFKKALELMQSLELQVVVCTPGVCMNLAKAAMHYGYDLHKDFSVSLFFLTGEMCTPELAANIDSLWGTSTYNILYGSQEAFVMGTTCKNRTMHLSEPNYVVEVLDPDTGESLGPSGTGELCVTTLISGIKPLVRYRTGDLVHVIPSDCDCEIPGPRLEVLGRVLDRINLGSGQHMAAALERAVLSGVTGVLGFQIVLDHNEHGVDVVTVRLELLPEAVDTAVAIGGGVTQRFREAFGVSAVVELVREVDQITSTGAFVSWKAARILDRRRERDAEENVAAEMARGRGFTT
jgi:phenylacetate-CoA ligase